jgi:DNA ligase-1
MVFDAPKMKVPFKKRIEKLKSIIDQINSKHVKLVEHSVCKSHQHLMEEMDKVCDKKGEGLMIRDPNSLYEGKRSDTLLKVKKFDDAEAVVIGHNKGTGRCSGMCGAIVVREKDGTEFKIGSGFDDS